MRQPVLPTSKDSEFLYWFDEKCNSCGVSIYVGTADFDAFHYSFSLCEKCLNEQSNKRIKQWA